MSRNLVNVFADYLGETTGDDESELMALGVNRTNFFQGAAVAAITRGYLDDKGGTWQPSPDGQRLWVVPCGERGPHKIGWRRIDDLCAFDLKNPARFYLLYGAADFINAEAIERATFYDDPLVLNDCPLSWLRGDTDGLVVLNWSLNYSMYFGDVKRVLADSWALKKKFLSAYEKSLPPKPDIRVREGVRNAA